MIQDHNTTDETLVYLTLAGDMHAYEMLVIRYQHAVIAAANTVLHSKYLAEDAAQDAFITAWMKLNLLHDPNKFGAWVCRIAKNCAKNMIVRYRTYLPLDELEGVLSDDANENPEVRAAVRWEQDTVQATVSGMPDRVAAVIRMYYFEERSVADIADMLGISEGTVKWQLHDGRKRIRGELCAMDETMNDTLTRRVMKKVEELKRWQYQNNKNGFEAIYNDVLSEVENLPESSDTQEKTKYSAMADVLMRGWWWLPGTKNDALFARIKEAAMRGHNDEVMAFIVSTEDQKYWGASRINFIRDVQIPMLEKNGFTDACAREWLWLGELYSEENDSAHAIEAFEMTQRLTGVDSLWHTWAGAAKEQEQLFDTVYRAKPEKTYRTRAGVEEIRFENGMPRRYTGNWFGKGLLCSVDLDADFVIRNASSCDGHYRIADAEIGQTFIGSDGTTLTFLEDGKTVVTPAGTFDDCQVWKVVRHEETYVTYYAENIGIVRQEKHFDGICEVRNLSSYIVRGTGYLPLVTGNVWEYTTDHAPEVITHTNRITVAFADEERAVLAQTWTLERLSYDENSWHDMILAIRNDYWDGEHVQDVTHYMQRAKSLAHTPVEIAHTAAACDVAQRIMDTNKEFNPQATMSGHWNFFARNSAEVTEDGRKIRFDGNFLWSFELKNIESTAAHQLLFNDIYDILNDDCGCIWSEDWAAGTKHTIHSEHYGTPICTEVVCQDGGTVTTAAGTFENCLCVCIDTQGYEDGLAYRGGKKNYTFAPGIGIVRVENMHFGGARTVVYELASYEGTGEGYQPLGDGFVRRYEALDLTDGYLSGVEYTYVTDEDGTTVIFENRIGVRKTPDRITEYSSIDSEQIEERLWDEGKHDESRTVHALNNIRLMMHFLGRPSRYWGAPDNAIAWNKYRLEMLEGLSQNGEIPRAWLGFYASTAFRLACALFGCGRNDEGYEWLERSFAPMEKWLSIPAGEPLEFGDPLIWGDITVERDGDWLDLQDGKREPISAELSYLFGNQQHLFYYGLTAPGGWEWFNGVREEERFKSYIPRAQALTEIK